MDADACPMLRLAEATREARFGEHGGVNPSIEVSTTFTVLDAKTLPDIFNGALGPDPKQGGCYLYGRSYSPTVQQLGRQLAAMEGTEAAYAVASGMAAISSALLGLCDAGDHIVASNCVYGGTHALLKTFLPRKAGMSVTFVDITDLAAVEAALTPGTKVLYCETVSNPTLVVADLPALAALAHRAGAALVVDNTFTPLAITPARWGADVVVHSLTKFVSGSSDIIAGAVCGRAALLASLMDLHCGPIMLQGPTMDPRIASELLMRLPHLHLRMAEHSRRAAAMADMLSSLGARVAYPGLPGHKGHAVLVRLLNPGYGFGGLVGVDMGSPANAEALMERLQNKHGFGLMAVSLGYADTLMSLSAASTSSELSGAERAAAAISGGYVRMSVGITGTLEQRLAQLRESYTFVADTNGVPPYKATKVRVAPDGSMTELVSWPSWGPEEEDGAEGEGKAAAGVGHIMDAAVAAVATAAQGADGVVAVGVVSTPPHAALAGHHKAAAGATDSGATGGGSSLTGAGAAGGDEGEVLQRRALSPAAAKLAAAGSVNTASRLAIASSGAEGAPRPVKMRKLDADTHVVYRPHAAPATTTQP